MLSLDERGLPYLDKLQDAILRSQQTKEEQIHKRRVGEQSEEHRNAGHLWRRNEGQLWREASLLHGGTAWGHGGMVRYGYYMPYFRRNICFSKHDNGTSTWGYGVWGYRGMAQVQYGDMGCGVRVWGTGCMDTPIAGPLPMHSVAIPGLIPPKWSCVD